MGNKNDSRKRRKSGPLRFKKKKFYGNKHTRQASDSTEDIADDISTPQSSFVVEEMQTASSRKLEESVCTSSSLPETHANNENPVHYIIIDSDIFKTILDVVGKCPTCHQKKLSSKTTQLLRKDLQIYLKLVVRTVNFFTLHTQANKLLVVYVDRCPLTLVSDL